MNKNKITVSAFAKRRAAGEKIVMVTAYDAPGAAAATAAGIDMILVGDSVGTTVLGYDSTLPVTMNDMLIHTKAVRRGAPDAFVVFDLPFMSYQPSVETGLNNSGIALKEAGADAVKLEGGAEHVELIRRLVGSGIPVMGHLGLLPQHVQAVGGYRVAGRSDAAAAQLLRDALALQEAGVFAVVLECVPAELGAKITAELDVPTIGIGSGAGCSGQIQVMHDLLGLLDFTPKHAKRYAEVGKIIREALASYATEVRNGVFPAESNSFK